MSDKVFNIDFMGYRKIAGVLSICLVLGAVVSLAVQGLNLGLDFTGGTLVEVAYQAPVQIAEVRDTLALPPAQGC